MVGKSMKGSRNAWETLTKTEPLIRPYLHIAKTKPVRISHSFFFNISLIVYEFYFYLIDHHILIVVFVLLPYISTLIREALNDWLHQKLNVKRIWQESLASNSESISWVRQRAVLCLCVISMMPRTCRWLLVLFFVALSFLVLLFLVFNFIISVVFFATLML